MAVGLGFGGCHVGEVLDHFLGVLCLAGAGLSRAENTLVLAVLNKQIKILPVSKLFWPLVFITITCCL